MKGTGASRRNSAASLDKSIHPANAAAFARLDASDQQAFLSLVHGLRLSLQTEREFLEWLPEIAFSCGQSVKAVLQSDGIIAAQKSTFFNAPQKIEKIREHLFSLRFPQYDATLKKWNQLAQKTFGKMSGVLVRPNPFFEKNKIELQISISSASQARELMARLAAVPESTWASLIDPFVS
jgi:hypothetical protein